MLDMEQGSPEWFAARCGKVTAGRQWCDFVSFDPRLPEDLRLFVTRIERDEIRIGELEEMVSEFLDELDGTIAALRKTRKAA
jgi:hypothetical protein